jgi:hypothetical protein
VLLVGGIVEPTAAFAGFGNTGLITVAVLFVVAESEDRDDSLDAALAAIEGVAGVALVSGFSEVR